MLAFTGDMLAGEPAKAGTLESSASAAAIASRKSPTRQRSPRAACQTFEPFPGLVCSRPVRRHAISSQRSVPTCKEYSTNPEFKEKFLDPNYLQPIVGSSDEFTRYVEADAAKWGKLIREAKITVE